MFDVRKHSLLYPVHVEQLKEENNKFDQRDRFVGEFRYKPAFQSTNSDRKSIRQAYKTLLLSN